MLKCVKRAICESCSARWVAGARFPSFLLLNDAGKAAVKKSTKWPEIATREQQ